MPSGTGDSHADELRAAPGRAGPAERGSNHELALRRAFEEGRTEYGELGLEPAPFAEALLDRVVRRLARAKIEATDDAIHEALSRSSTADLYLTLACERGEDAAWRVFAERFRPRLAGLVRKRGASAAEAAELLDELPGELISPAESGGPPRLANYDGTGSLFGWLAVFVTRRRTDRVRSRKHESLEAIEESGGAPAGERSTGSEADDPSESAAASEAATAVRGAVEAAWSELGDRHRLALLFKYRDGLPQKEIARLFSVGEPRVTRILQAALEKLRAAVEPLGLDSEQLADMPAFWAELAGNLADSLQSLDAAGDPPVAGGT